MIKHKHHIIPKHAGGTDDPENLVELSITEHAEAHRKLYEQHGRLQDKLAWQGLLGLISCAEIVYALQSEGKRGNKNPMYGKPAPNRGVKRPGVGGRKKGSNWSASERAARLEARDTEEYKNKMKDVYANPERNRRIGEKHKGKTGASCGKKWYNNGSEEKYFIQGQQPDGWINGRISKK